MESYKSLHKKKSEQLSGRVVSSGSSLRTNSAAVGRLICSQTVASVVSQKANSANNLGTRPITPKKIRHPRSKSLSRSNKGTIPMDGVDDDMLKMMNNNKNSADLMVHHCETAKNGAEIGTEKEETDSDDSSSDEDHGIKDSIVQKSKESFARAEKRIESAIRELEMLEQEINLTETSSEDENPLNEVSCSCSVGEPEHETEYDIDVIQPIKFNSFEGDESCMIFNLDKTISSNLVKNSKYEEEEEEDLISARSNKTFIIETNKSKPDFGVPDITTTTTAIDAVGSRESQRGMMRSATFIVSSNSGIDHKFLNPPQQLLESSYSSRRPNSSLNIQVPENSPFSGTLMNCGKTSMNSLNSCSDLLTNVGDRFQNFTFLFLTQVKVMDKILKFLSPRDILNCRLVCRTWSQTISNSTLFWNRLHILKRRESGLRWTDLLNSDLCMTYACPNYHLVQCDLRRANAFRFFATVGPQIKWLKLYQCSFSVKTLQNLLIMLGSLEYLEIIGIDSSVLFSESIFPSPPSQSAAGFPCLTTLYLKHSLSNEDKRLEATGVIDSIPPLISKDVLKNLLMGCKSLKIIGLNGFESQSCYDLLEIIYLNNIPSSQIKELHFINLPSENLSFAHFYRLANSLHSIRLQKLSICLNSDYWFSDNSGKFEATYLDMVFSDILQAHATTLIELTLNYCPISPNVFKLRMPKLKKLLICGTKINQGKIDEMVALRDVYETFTDYRGSVVSSSGHDGNENNGSKTSFFYYDDLSRTKSKLKIRSGPELSLRFWYGILFIIVIGFILYCIDEPQSLLAFVLGISIVKYLTFVCPNDIQIGNTLY